MDTVKFYIHVSFYMDTQYILHYMQFPSHLWFEIYEPKSGLGYKGNWLIHATKPQRQPIIISNADELQCRPTPHESGSAKILPDNKQLFYNSICISEIPLANCTRVKIPGIVYSVRNSLSDINYDFLRISIPGNFQDLSTAIMTSFLPGISLAYFMAFLPSVDMFYSGFCIFVTEYKTAVWISVRYRWCGGAPGCARLSRGGRYKRGWPARPIDCRLGR